MTGRARGGQGAGVAEAVEGLSLGVPLSPAELRQLTRDLDYLGILVSFPWHAQQRAALASASNNVVVLGGNQSGKSMSALGIVSRLVRREGPVYRRLRNPGGRPLKVWVSPQTGEKYRSLWEAKLIGQVFAGMEYRYVQSPQPVFTWEDAEGGGTVWGKSQEQGFQAFESDAVDLVVFDEEPVDKRVYTSAVQRTATTNGVIVSAFTPLLGMTWTHGTLYEPAVRDEHRVADRVWRLGNHITVIKQGMADNPASVAGGGVARLVGDPSLTEAERNTRLYGDYGYTEGLIWPGLAGLVATAAAGGYMVDRLPADRSYTWVLACDPNKKHGGVLVAIDWEENWYVVAEHYREAVPDSRHALDYLEILSGLRLKPNLDVGVWADPGGAGAQAIVNMAEVGLFAAAVPKDAGSVKASIERVRRQLWVNPGRLHPETGAQGAPGLYFLRSLRSQWRTDGVEYDESRLLWEIRQYRQKANGRPDEPVKEKDDCVDPLRYVALVRPAPPVVTGPGVAEARRGLDGLSVAADEEFEKLAAAASKPAARRFEW